MSECVEIFRRDEIRTGDIIRIESGEGSINPVRAVEYIAKRDGHLADGFVYTFTEVAEPGRKAFLLDRAVTLPTALYSLVVPPPALANNASAYVLEPTNSGPKWLQGGSFVDAAFPARQVAEGWTIIEQKTEVSE